MKRITNCRLCGLLKSCEDYTLACLCDECDIKAFNTIKEYLKENGPKNEIEIRENTNIPLAIIKGYKYHNRLEEIIKELNKTVNKCQKCGSIISAPGLCNVCQGLADNKNDNKEEKVEPIWHSRRR